MSRGEAAADGGRATLVEVWTSPTDEVLDEVVQHQTQRARDDEEQRLPATLPEHGEPDRRRHHDDDERHRRPELGDHSGHLGAVVLTQVVSVQVVRQLLVAHRQWALERHLEQEERERDGDKHEGEDYQRQSQAEPGVRVEPVLQIHERVTSRGRSTHVVPGRGDSQPRLDRIAKKSTFGSRRTSIRG